MRFPHGGGYTAVVRPHLRDLSIDEYPARLRAAGDPAPEAMARRLALHVHRRHAFAPAELGIGRARFFAVERAFSFGPQLETADVREADDGTRKILFRTRTGEEFETVLIRNREQYTACLSSQAGCALGCTFCATAALGLLRNLTAGEIAESLHRTERRAGIRVTDIVFMGQGEPLQNYDAVMTACTNFNHDLGGCVSRKKISISTSGLTDRIRRFTRERRPWRLYLSLHAADDAVRRTIMPIARHHPLPGLIDAMCEYQRECRMPWVTLQYVAIPGVNMDDAAIDALRTNLAGLRYILNVIPYNDVGVGYRPPSWREVKDFTTRLRTLGCPVKTRYSAGKQDGMGCGQLAAERLAVAPAGGHLDAPPGAFSDL